MVTAASLSVNARATGVSIVIPDNDVARLMYYLNCVTIGVGIDILDDDLVDYRNYRRLSPTRVALVLRYAGILDPRELVGQIIFLDDEGEVCGSSSNEFCDIDVACSIISIQREAIIGGRVRNVTKVMFFKSSWLANNYIRPLTRLSRPAIMARPAIRRQPSNDCVVS